MGVTEPEATFSACFGGAFLMWHPMKYAAMLAQKMEQHGTSAWLVNTGCAHSPQDSLHYNHEQILFARSQEDWHINQKTHVRLSDLDQVSLRFLKRTVVFLSLSFSFLSCLGNKDACRG